MPETKEKLPGLTRRSFLKTTAAVAGTAVFASTIGCNSIDRRTGQDNASGEQIRYCCCHAACDMCQYEVVVREGHVVNVRPQQAAVEDRALSPQRMCLRGRSHVRKIYDPNRVRYPMKRTGARGENKWEQISWDEAISTITTKWKADIAQYGSQAVCFWAGSGANTYLHGVMGINRRLANVAAFSLIDMSVDSAAGVGVGRIFGGGGYPSSEVTDVKNSKTYFAWSRNITQAYTQFWTVIADAQEKGVKIISVDPSYTIFSSKADIWMRPRPATDAALIMSMIQVIVAEDWHDKEFLLKRTVAPVLIKPDTKKYLRMSDLGIEPIEGPPNAYGQPTLIDPIVVWDNAIDGPAAFEEAIEPALKGTRTINGVQMRTGFDILMEEINKYTPEKASQICDVSPGEIRELAKYAVNTPCRHETGFGAQSYNNGTHPHQALGVLMCVTGNLGYPGASFGTSNSAYRAFNPAFAMPTGMNSKSVSALTLADVIESGTSGGTQHIIKDLYVACANPLAGAVNCKKMEKAWDKLDLIVVHSMMFDDTARYADIVLPAVDWWEHTDIKYNGSFPIVFLNEQAVPPAFEAKTDTDVIRLFANALGHSEHFNKSDEQYLEEILQFPAGIALGITLDALKRNHQMRFADSEEVGFSDFKYNTNTGLAAIYNEAPTPRMNMGQTIDLERERIPHFFPPTEAWPEHEIMKKYPLILMSERNRAFCHTQDTGNTWLNEIDPEPTIKINPDDAKARNIDNGDYVDVYNDRGHAVAIAVITPAMRPGSVMYPKGWNKHQFKAGRWTELLTDEFDPVGVNMSFFDNVVEIRKWDGEV